MTIRAGVGLYDCSRCGRRDCPSPDEKVCSDNVVARQLVLIEALRGQQKRNHETVYALGAACIGLVLAVENRLTILGVEDELADVLASVEAFRVATAQTMHDYYR